MSHPTRRTVLAGAAAAAALAATASGGPAVSRLPVVFLPHGGGPWPWMDPDAFGPGAMESLRAYLRDLPGTLGTAPRALLAVSAHWEEAVPTVTTAAAPPMLYDYYGFPRHTYEIRWPAPGDPELAGRVRSLLGEAGFDTAEDPRRGFDHGTFVPLAVSWPEATIPTVQLSLVWGLDPDVHLRIGRALAPLREEGVLVVASGMSYHNMRGFGTPAGRAASEQFDAWLREVVTAEPDVRDDGLRRWAQAPSARACHPREEHLIPLMVAAGAAGADRGSVRYNDAILGTRCSGVHFG